MGMDARRTGRRTRHAGAHCTQPAGVRVAVEAYVIPPQSPLLSLGGCFRRPTLRAAGRGRIGAGHSLKFVPARRPDRGGRHLLFIACPVQLKGRLPIFGSRSCRAVRSPADQVIWRLKASRLAGLHAAGPAPVRNPGRRMAACNRLMLIRLHEVLAPRLGWPVEAGREHVAILRALAVASPAVRLCHDCIRSAMGRVSSLLRRYSIFRLEMITKGHRGTVC
jgi:hypothetical protein